ncbi:MAG: PLP-dependent aminotransferase family protein [Firmicutes bacterium]|nr:PLP-dependent aminotransferase family protein [Bacillota bacterium]
MHPQRFLSPAARLALAYPPPGAWMPPLPPGVVRLSAGYPFPESVPVADLAAALEALLAEEADAPLHYLGSRAMAALPGLIRQRLAQRGIPVGEGELLVTSGACQAIDLAARALIAPGAPVAVEAPTYMEALEIFRNYTDAILGYPVDREGLVVEALAEDLRRRRTAGKALPRLLYTIPSFQNPTGATLSLERRRRLLALAEEYDFLILEDDAYGELAFDPQAAPPPLKALDTRGRVVYLGSLSKVVAPGLRIGWAAGPEPVIRAMAVFKKDLDHPLAWALTARYLQGTDLPARLAWLRQRYRERRNVLLGALAREMPAGVTWTEPAGGYFVWVSLPPGLDSEKLLPAALAAGVAYVPGRHFYFGPAAAQGARHLRLSFSYLPPAELERGVAALARAVRAAG